jgi:nucleoside 2-deoxyribosyltransferase
MTKAVSNTVFLAAPMASYADDEAYQRDRAGVLQIKAALAQSGFDVIYPGEGVASLNDFEASHMAVIADYAALRTSDYFLCLYFAPVLSSVLVEAGLALALEKPSVYFVSRRADLPFLLRGADMAFPAVKIYEVADAEAAAQLIEAQGATLFTGALSNLSPASSVHA